MDKREMIKSYILAKDITDEEKKERFEIARDIYLHLPSIMLEQKRAFISRVKGYLEEDEKIGKNFQIVDDGLVSGKTYGKIRIFKNEWKDRVHDNVYVQSYALNGDQSEIRDLLVGIPKGDERKGIPFKGNWQVTKEPARLIQLSKKIFNSVSKKTKKGNRHWPVYFYLEPPYRIKRDQELDFFCKILTKDGVEESAQYICDEIKHLIDDTEELIDEFVKVYNEMHSDLK